VRTVSSFSVIDKRVQKLLTLECLIVPGAIQSVVILIRILPQSERDMEEGYEKEVAIETEELSAMWSGGGGVTSENKTNARQ